MTNDVVKYFMLLAAIDSESKNERNIADRVIEDLRAMGAVVEEDDIHLQTGGNAGNILARFAGKVQKAPIMFCAHIDTVKPGINVKPQLLEDRVISDGNSVLGADDKSGVAEIICGIQQVLDSGIDHAPIEVLFTVSEEIGLLGAKLFDKSKLKAAFGYALDAQDIGEIVIGAPSQNSITINVFGLEAHAGVQPEKGISAIRVASEAISAMPLGRIDFETTSNIGVISGGIATNIVPNRVDIKGEARSHNPAKLNQVCKDMEAALRMAVQKHDNEYGKASYDMSIKREYDSFFADSDSEVVRLAVLAMQEMDIEPLIQKGGGGSDANIINTGGVPTVILGTGMHSYHTVNEYIKTEDLQKGAALISKMIQIYSK